MAEGIKKIVRQSESLRNRGSRYQTDLYGKSMKMLKGPNKTFGIVKVRDSGYSRYRMSTVIQYL